MKLPVFFFFVFVFLFCLGFFCFFCWFFFLLSFFNGIHSLQDSTANRRHGVTKRSSTKRLKHRENLFKRKLQLEFKAIQIIAQRKAFYRQSILESSCVRKETVDIAIVVTSRNGDRKIMKSIRIMIRPSSTIRKWNHLSQFSCTCEVLSFSEPAQSLKVLSDE